MVLLQTCYRLQRVGVNMLVHLAPVVPVATDVSQRVRATMYEEC